MNFASLSRFSNRIAGRVFTRDTDNRPMTLWFSSKAELRRNPYLDDFTVRIDEPAVAPARFASQSVATQLNRLEVTGTVSFAAGALPYRPKKGQTRFLYGHGSHDWRCAQVQDYRVVEGFMEIEYRDVELPPLGTAKPEPEVVPLYDDPSA